METESKKNDFKLDDDAQALFKSINGIDKRIRTRLSPSGKGQMAKDFLEKQKEFDKTRLDLSNMFYHIGRYILKTETMEDSSDQQIALNEISMFCRTFCDPAAKKKTILLRYRGLSSVSKADIVSGYEIIFDEILLNSDVAQSTMQRQGKKAAYLQSQMESTFHMFEEKGISSFFLRLPRNNQMFSHLFKSLQVIAQYFETVKTGGKIVIGKGDNRFSITPVVDENGRPDPNLTMLAVLNNFKSETIHRLIEKVNTMLQKRLKSDSIKQHLNVYSAIPKVKSLKNKLVYPPIEVNNIKWLVVDNSREKISKEKVQVTKLAVDNSEGQPAQTARILKSVYGKDYAQIDSREVAERLQMSSGLLQSIEKKSMDKSIEKEVITNVEERLDQVSDEVYDRLLVSANEVKHVNVKDGKPQEEHKKETLFEKINTRLSDLVAFFKKRSVTKRKMKQIVNRVVDFDSQDYETLAKDFEVSVEDARELIELLKTCFDEKGNFKRGTFAKIIPEFMHFERRIFEFLWHYLKEAIHQTDRAAFINSLQLLVARLKRPKNALKILLDDLCKNSKKVKFADRRALMLGNLLLRKYNHELVDYQFTPEDVLSVKEGLEKNATSYVQWKIRQSIEAFTEKINTMHNRLLESLAQKEEDSQVMDTSHMIGQEREAMIFLSLVGGENAAEIISGALEEYCDSGADVYNLTQSQKYLSDLLQIFKVLVRGAGRFDREQMAHILEQANRNIEGIKALGSDIHHEDIINQIKERITLSLQAIS